MKKKSFSNMAYILCTALFMLEKFLSEEKNLIQIDCATVQDRLR
jgi:hypothetical protein